MTDLTNKVIWITGASSGIGKALAQTAAQHDTKLILSGRRTDALDALADENPHWGNYYCFGWCQSKS